MTRRPKTFRTILIALASSGLLLLSACVSFGADSYDEFSGAVKGGASCRELFDIKTNFDSANDLERIERDLDEIGCKSPRSTRDDI